MEVTVCNPQKERLETIHVEFTDENTTWFDDCVDDEEVYMIPDFKEGIIIRKFGIGRYPFWIYDITRDEIGHDPKKAKELIDPWE
ncbi:MAG: hypothetical protein ACE5K3_08490 [bacterium]